MKKKNKLNFIQVIGSKKKEKEGGGGIVTPLLAGWIDLKFEFTHYL